MSASVRNVVRSVSVVAALCLAALGLAAPASAVRAHALTSTFGAGQISSSTGLAVNAVGDVFVLDSDGVGGSRVQRFASDGRRLGQFPVQGTTALAAGINGDVYVVDAGANAVHRYGPSGTSLGDLSPSTPFTSVSAVAVDPVDGDVYVGDGQFPARVVVFNVGGTPVSEFTGDDVGGFTQISGLAVDGQENVVVLDPNSGQAFKYGDRGVQPSTPLAPDISFPAPQALAAEPTGVAPHVYLGISRNNQTLVMRDIDAGGNNIYEFGIPGSAFGPFVPSAATADRVYVADQNQNRINVYSAFDGPTVTTGTATASGRAATLTGTVNPEGAAVRYRFEIGDAPGGAPTITTPYENLPAGASDVNVSAEVMGLEPQRTYYYRLVAESSAGSVSGQENSFATTTAPTQPGEVSISNVTDTSADLSASIGLSGQTATYAFEYGTDTSYGFRTPTRQRTPFPANDPLTASESLSGLQPNTTYHVRAVADNGTGGEQAGPDATFTTGPPRPVVAAAAPSAVSTSTAALAGTVNPQGSDTSYYFSVTGTDNAFQANTAVQQLSGGSGASPVSSAVSGLPAGRSFVVRVVATNANGTRSSDPVAFSTAPSAPESVSLVAPIVDLGGLYGCTAPRLNAVSRPVKAGQVLKLTGSDLGASGRVNFGSKPARIGDYSTYEIEVRVPSGIKDRTPVTLNCGRPSNSVLVRTGSLTPRVSSSVKGSTATLTVRVPAAGKVSISGKGVGSASKSASKAGTLKLSVKLTSAGRSALRRAKAGRLRVTLKVGYKPRSGAGASTRSTVAFKR